MLFSARHLVLLTLVIGTTGCKNEEPIRCGEGTVLVGRECVLKTPEGTKPSIPSEAHNDAAPPEPTPKTTALSFETPIVIDGVEFILSKATLGPLPKGKQDRYSMFKLPEGTFLQVQAKLRNTSDTKILVIQDVWNNTMLIDEHDNRMPALGSEMSMNQAIKDLEPHGQLRPGHSIDGLLMFEAPIEAAKDFKITCDPGIYVQTDNVMIRPVSQISFDIAFSRSDVHANPP